MGINPIAAPAFSDAPVPLEAGELNQLYLEVNFRNLGDSKTGDSLFLGLAVTGENLTIASATAGTPEPASGLLLLVDGEASQPLCVADRLADRRSSSRPRVVNRRGCSVVNYFDFDGERLDTHCAITCCLFSCRSG